VLPIGLLVLCDGGDLGYCLYIVMCIVCEYQSMSRNVRGSVPLVGMVTT